MISRKSLARIATAAGIIVLGTAACAGPNDTAPVSPRPDLEATVTALTGENLALRKELESLRLTPMPTPTPIPPTPTPIAYKEKLARLEGIIGSNYRTYMEEAYNKFLQLPNSLELARALGNEFENIIIDGYIRFLQNNGEVEQVTRARAAIERNLNPADLGFLLHPQAIDLIELLGKEYQSSTTKDYAKLLQTKDGLELAKALGTTFNSSRVTDYVNFLSKEGKVQDVRRSKEIIGTKFTSYNSESILELLLQPQGLNLIETLQEQFSTLEIENYLKLLEAPDAIPLVKALGKEFSHGNIPDYVNFLSKEGKVEQVTRARELMRGEFKKYNVPQILLILAHPEGMSLIEAGKESISPSHGSYYVKLLELGLDPRGVARIPSYKVREISDALETTKMPTEFIDYFTHSPSEFAIEAAGRNPVFGSDDEKLRTNIKSRIISRSNCTRPGTDYKEDVKQVDSVGNINILYLIKGYLDFFDNTQNLQSIFEIVEQDINNPYTEEGGLVLPDKDGYRFFRYNLRDGGLKNLENDGSWPVPDWFDYVGRIGIFHMHALGEDNSQYCGPSGSAKSVGGDTRVLKRFNENNLYEADVVITKLPGQRINVDVYFRDVFEHMLGKSNEESVTVVDLGVYEKPAKASSVSLEQAVAA